jgi:putative ABC transport system substrate-binding protein
MDRRRFLVASLAGVLAAPGAAGAQGAGRVYRIALIASGAPSSAPTGQGPLLSERLQELGWIAGRDFVTEQRAYGDQIERIPELAADLMRTRVDVFVVEAADARRVQQVTRTIPIVTLRAGDIVEAGLATSLARPGGNVTGIQTLQPQLAAKHLSLLKEAIPRLSRTGILFGLGMYDAVLREATAAGKTLGIALQIVALPAVDQLPGAFSSFQAEQAQAVVVVRSAYLTMHQKTVVDLALKHRLPTISDSGSHATLGGLMSYGYSLRGTVRSAADIVDKILRGAKASEIPIQQSTTFQFVINLKTAKMLGFAIPPSLLARADQIIE